MSPFEDLGVDISGELLNLEGDPRLVRRSRRLLERWQDKPGVGFPEAFGDTGELEAAYRFFGNPGLCFDDLVRPFEANSVQRCRRYSEVIVIQDTTTFVFEGERKGLGFINKNNRGFLGHFALAVSSDEARVPLGVIGASVWTRATRRSAKPVSQHKLRQSEDCESHRWRHTASHAEQLLRGVSSPIHVMDREGDIYDSLSTMVVEHMRFVVRASTNRTVEADDPDFRLLFDALDGLPIRYRDVVTVSPRLASRLPDQRRGYPARDGRQAQIAVTATPVTIKRTRNSTDEFPPTTTLNMVHVFETDTSANQDAVEWVLLTSEPIATDDDLHRIIDFYRRRWLIEEFFKAIKTGCAYERRQLESYHALANALALALPIAWSMLLFRSQSRSDPAPSATPFIDPFRLKVLKAHPGHYKLPDQPTLRDVAYSIAGMGGHLKRNGPPGWQTLRRGFERLLTLEEGWIRARESCDQS